MPMVVWKQHGDEPPDAEVEHMLAQLGAGGRPRSSGAGRVVVRPGDAPDPRPLPRPRPGPQLVVPPVRAAVTPGPAMPRDQVPGLQAPAGTGPHRAGPRLRGPHRARPVLRDHPGGPGLEAAGHGGHRGGQRPGRPRAGPLLRGHRSGARPRSPVAEVAEAVDRLNAVGGPGRVRDRHLLRGVPVLPARERRPDRRRARRHRGRLRRYRPLAGAADQPVGGGRPGRLDHRPADGLPQAVGAAGRPAAGAAGARSCWPVRAGP